MNNVLLNIREWLPHITSAQDQSITRLIGSLEKRKGFNRYVTEKARVVHCINQKILRP